MSQSAERVLAQWAALWSAHDPDAVLRLFTDDCIYEDVTFGIVNQGKGELRIFAERVFAAHPDFRIDLKSQFVAGDWAAMEWIMTGTHEGDLAGMPGYAQKVLDSWSLGCGT
jgi:steroid delta-isomerase-like uncharacterized protein